MKKDGTIADSILWWRVLGVHILQEELGIPTVGIEKEYTLAGVGQLRTRIQAFVESLEIKHIQGGKL